MKNQRERAADHLAKAREIIMVIVEDLAKKGHKESAEVWADRLDRAMQLERELRR